MGFNGGSIDHGEGYLDGLIENNIRESLEYGEEKRRIQGQILAGVKRILEFQVVQPELNRHPQDEAALLSSGKIPQPLRSLAVRQSLEGVRPNVPKVQMQPFPEQEIIPTLPPITIRLFSHITHLCGLEPDELRAHLTTLEMVTILSQQGKLELLLPNMGISNVLVDITMFQQTPDGAMVIEQSMDRFDTSHSWPRIRDDFLGLVRGVGGRGNVIGKHELIDEEGIRAFDWENRRISQSGRTPLVVYSSFFPRGVDPIQSRSRGDMWSHLAEPYLYIEGYQDNRVISYLNDVVEVGQ